MLVSIRRCAAIAPLLMMLLLACSGCGETARLSAKAGTGPNPTLPPPANTLVPTVRIAPATGWPAGTTPIAAPGLAVNAFATGLTHPRWIYVLPNGDVLVAETNGPPDSGGFKGIRATLMTSAMKKAGAAVPSPNRITLLRDKDGDGVAETRTVFL